MGLKNSLLRCGDFVVIRRYGDRYKMIYFRYGRKPPEDREGRQFGHSRVDLGGNESESGGNEPRRLQNNISRAKGRVFELGMCNPWEWFFTGTLDGARWDRGDLDAWYGNFSQYIRDQRRKGYLCAYLLIPEQHKDGSWHIHGLLSGFPPAAFRAFSLDERLPMRIIKKLQKGEQVYEWVGYRRRYGFNTLEPLRDRQRAAAYVTKYITKDFGGGGRGGAPGLEPGKHLYYASRGLAGSELLLLDRIAFPSGYRWDFEGDYCKILWKDSLEDFGLEGLRMEDGKVVYSLLDEKFTSLDNGCDWEAALKKAMAQAAAERLADLGAGRFM